MSNPNQWVLIKQIANVTVDGGNVVRHKAKNGTWVDNSTLMFDVYGSRERHQRGGTE
jgi:hypothetical protein